MVTAGKQGNKTTGDAGTVAAADIKFSGNNRKLYKGIVDSTASRIDTEKRSLAARIKMDNSNLEILPGALLEIK